MYTIVGIGERPDRLPGGYNIYHPRNVVILNRIIKKLLKILQEHPQIHCKTDVDQGYGQLFTIACLTLKSKGYDIFLEAVLARPGLEKIWPIHVREQYLTLISGCDKVTYISDGPYYVGCMTDWINEMFKDTDMLLTGYNNNNTYTQKHINDAKARNIIISIISIT